MYQETSVFIPWLSLDVVSALSKHSGKCQDSYAAAAAASTPNILRIYRGLDKPLSRRWTYAMPSPAYSTAFLAVLTTKFKKTPATDTSPRSLIEDDAVMLDIGLPRMYDKTWCPRGMNEEAAKHFHSFIESCTNEPNNSLMNFIATGATAVAGRSLYRTWFPSIVRKFNIKVEDALTESGFHPCQLMATCDDPDFPTGDDASARASVPVAYALFGSAAFNGGTVLLDTNLIKPIKYLLTHTFKRLRKKWIKAKKDIVGTLQRMEDAMQAIEDAQEDDGATLKQVKEAILACTAVSGIAIWFPQHQAIAEANVKQLREMIANSERYVSLVENIAEGPIKSRRPEAEALTRRARARGKTMRISQVLSTSEQIESVKQALLSHLENQDPVQDNRVQCPMPLTFDDDRHDLGVDRFSGTPFEELSRLLAFRDGLPVLWTRHARSDGITPWSSALTDDERQGFETGGPGFRTIVPLWHQLVGVCSMMYKLFTKKKKEDMPGTILADDVGVGKTVQVMASIAFTQQVYLSEQKDTPRPPLIHNRPYYLGKGPVNNAAHLIIVPLCLMGQWRKELQTFFAPGAIDIIDLPQAIIDVETFFTDKSSDWGKSGQEPIDRIVLCAHSTFEHIVGKTFAPRSSNGALPVDHPLKRTKESRQTTTLFDIPWTGVYVDEGHLFRGDTLNFQGIIHLRLAGNNITCVTATPFYNKPHDVVNIARMIGLRKFCLADGQSYEKEIDRRLQAAKRSVAMDSEPTLEEILESIQADADDLDNELTVTKREIMAEFQDLLGDNIIRRTLQSKKPDGTPLNDKIPVIHSHIITIDLTERERAKLGDCSGNVSGSSGVRSDFNLECFWLYYRLAVLFWVAKGDSYPVFLSDGSTQDGLRYRDVPSSKLNMLARILLHLLFHDDIGHPEDHDGELVFPPRTTRAQGDNSSSDT
ncbi:hypothetical protein ONZ45_g18379 [Pleurotus djamor]|nr:hypothetical protein ONZ45_g18379 [Pleurotus djamor]